MIRIFVAVVAVGVLAGCSSSSTEPTSASSSAAATAGYFTQTETDALNKGYAEYPPAVAAASDAKAMKKCNALRTGDNKIWVNCWTGLLTPVEKSLVATANGLESVAAGTELRPECKEELESVAENFIAYKQDIAGLIKQFEGSPAAQAKATKVYLDTMRENDQKIPDGFKSLTQVCYSPEDLAKIEASQSASPS